MNIRSLNVDALRSRNARRPDIHDPNALWCVALDAVTTQKYAALDVLPVWKHVLLHHGVCPDFMGEERIDDFCVGFAFASKRSSERGHERRCAELAKSLHDVDKAVRRNELRTFVSSRTVPALQRLVLREDFDRYAVDLPRLGPWSRRYELGMRPMAISLEFAYETRLLRVLQALFQRFAQLRESASPTFIPRAADLESWLMATLGVKQRTVRSYLITIARPDDLPKGRHPSEGKKRVAPRRRDDRSSR